MLKFGIVGAGPGSFIGDVHIRGAEATHKAQLVAGCFSRHEDINKQCGIDRGIASDRVYKDAFEMAKIESQREDKIDFVVISTPNIFHYEQCKAFLEAGINVSCDKPVTTEVAQAEELKKIAEEKGLKFCITFTYSGYPMLRHVRDIIASGQIGEITMISAEYVQDWMAGTNNINPWRTDPKLAGKVNCLGDLGSHIMFTTRFLTGLEIDEVCTQFERGGYQSDINSCVMLKYKNGASGMYWTTQIAYGNDNNVRFRIYGTEGAIEWYNQDAERIQLTLKGEPPMMISKNRTYGNETLNGGPGRLAAGHEEGWYYVFANIYDAFVSDLLGEQHEYYPTIDDGIVVAKWIDGCFESDKERKWIKL